MNKLKHLQALVTDREKEEIDKVVEWLNNHVPTTKMTVSSFISQSVMVSIKEKLLEIEKEKIENMSNVRIKPTSKLFYEWYDKNKNDFTEIGFLGAMWQYCKDKGVKINKVFIDVWLSDSKLLAYHLSVAIDNHQESMEKNNDAC